MKKKFDLKSFVCGVLVVVLTITLAAPVSAAVSGVDITAYYNVKLVVDGKELVYKYDNGQVAQPFLSGGVTYLPVRAVAEAVDKAVYWDGPSRTVYVGSMDGKLEYPTATLNDLTNIATDKARTTNKLKDNYGKTYSYAITNYPLNRINAFPSFESLTAMKYSHFKGTLYVPEGTNSEKTGFLTVTADGHEIYRSPEMSKASAPVQLDVNISGYNDVNISFGEPYYSIELCLGDAGFYQ